MMTGRLKGHCHIDGEYIGVSGDVKVIIFLSLFLYITTAVTTAHAASNTHLIEERVETMEKINQEALKQVPEIPRDGRIELEAEGYERGGNIEIEVKRYKVAPLEERTINLDESPKEPVAEEKHDEG